MRRLVAALLFVVPASAAADDLSRARALDQQGVKAYTEHRYNDAIRYFEESYRLGGPPFELWNIAKCRIELDQPEEAIEMIDKYLAQPNVSGEDRKEAQQQRAALEKRPSTLSVTSSPSGASVTIDGKPEGKTPLSLSVPPGNHTVTVSVPKREPYTKTVEARLGRAIILDVPSDDMPAPVDHDEDVHPVNLRGFFGFGYATYGSFGSSAMPVGVITASYRVTKLGSASFTVGGLLHFTHDSWDNSVNAPTTGIASCPGGVLTDYQSATAFSAFFTGGLSFPVIPKLDVGGAVGVGLANYFAGSNVGGDLFVPTCQAAPGGRPALTIVPQIDYALTPLIRLSAMPFGFHVQPAFDGARGSPKESSGIWTRFTFAIGAGVDLR